MLKFRHSRALTKQFSRFSAINNRFYTIDGAINASSQKYKDNEAEMYKYINKFNDILQTTVQGGSKTLHEKHIKRGKLFVRDRINNLLDFDSSFLELSSLAGYNLYPELNLPAGGIITGLGYINQRLCMIIANDATVKGGTYFPITVKKHLRAQSIASKLKVPCIYLVDSGGAFLPMQDEVFPDENHFGRIFYNQANMSSRGIPQVSVVMGSCTAGGAYMPAMSDESIIVKNTGTIFLGGPPLVKAATGEIVTAEELGGAILHTSSSGLCDYLAENDSHALSLTRNIIAKFKSTNEVQSVENELESEDIEPKFDKKELNGIIPFDSKETFDIRLILSRILDKSEFFEFKENYGKTLICGFGKINNIKIGIVANNGILFSESSLKGCSFIQICSQQKIPLLFVQNLTGFMVGKSYEERGIAKDGAKLVTAVSCTSVPKITLIIGNSYGAGNYGMCGRAFNPDFLFTWPNSKIGVMGGEQAGNVLATIAEDNLRKKMGDNVDEAMIEKEKEKVKKPILEKFDKETSAFYSTARLWDDGIILPEDTRNVLSLAFKASLAYRSEEDMETKFGNFRM